MALIAWLLIVAIPAGLTAQVVVANVRYYKVWYQ
jgi:hypothetical protein